MTDPMRHFKLYELVDRVTWYTEGDNAWGYFNVQALQSLDNLRDFFGAPLTINTWWWNPNGFQFRGYRPPTSTVGAPQSQHRVGMPLM